MEASGRLSTTQLTKKKGRVHKPEEQNPPTTHVLGYLGNSIYSSANELKAKLLTACPAHISPKPVRKLAHGPKLANRHSWDQRIRSFDTRNCVPDTRRPNTAQTHKTTHPWRRKTKDAKPTRESRLCLASLFFFSRQKTKTRFRKTTQIIPNWRGEQSISLNECF